MFGNATDYIIHEIRLTGLPGRNAVGTEPLIATDYTADGINWSQPRFKNVGKTGDRNKLISWRRLGKANQQRIHRFSGTSSSHIGVARIDMRIERLGF